MDSVINKDGNYCPEMFLIKDCRYIEEKIIRHINDNLSDISSFNKYDDEE